MSQPFLAVACCLLLLSGCQRTNEPNVRQDSNEPAAKQNPSTDIAPSPTEETDAKPSPPEDPPAVDPGPAPSVSDAPPPTAINPPSPPAADANTADANSREVRLEKMILVAPESWQRTPPPFPIIAAQFELPHVEGDTRDGQLTITKVGAFDAQKLEEMRQQFVTQAKDAEVQQLEISGVKVTVFDFSGTNDVPEGQLGAVAGPYRMLNVFLPLEGKLYLVNCSGPQKTIDKYAEEFHAFLLSMKPGESS